MREELPARVIDKWRGYDAIEGLPDLREDIRAGILASLIFNTAPHKKGTKRRGPGDFFPSLKPEPKKPTDGDTGSSTQAERLMEKARAAFGPMLQKKKAAPDGQRSDAPRKP